MILYDHDQIYETDYTCTKCKTPRQTIDEEKIPEIPCSECGEKALRVE